MSKGTRGAVLASDQERLQKRREFFIALLVLIGLAAASPNAHQRSCAVSDTPTRPWVLSYMGYFCCRYGFNIWALSTHRLDGRPGFVIRNEYSLVLRRSDSRAS